MTTFATSRRFPAAPAAVFNAFSDADALARWWGPTGFTNEFESFEFAEGGRWTFVMVGPDGKRYPNNNRFERIEASRPANEQNLNRLGAILGAAAG